MSDKQGEMVRVFLDVLPINTKKFRKEPQPEDYDNEYTISVRRKDGRGMSEDEAEAIIYEYFMFKRMKAKKPRSATK